MCRPCPGRVTSGTPLSGAWSWTEIRALCVLHADGFPVVGGQQPGRVPAQQRERQPRSQVIP
jgi:hypothetical protein